MSACRCSGAPRAALHSRLPGSNFSRSAPATGTGRFHCRAHAQPWTAAGRKAADRRNRQRGSRLLPPLLHDIRQGMPGLSIEITEDRTIRLLPRLLSGRHDLAFVRPPEQRNSALAFEHIVYETAVVAMAAANPLSAQEAIRIGDLPVCR